MDGLGGGELNGLGKWASCKEMEGAWKLWGEWRLWGGCPMQFSRA
jgi:hypothetical protein